jgi:hypothetical protein
MDLKLALHADAAKNFEEKAASLLLELAPEPERRPKENHVTRASQRPFSPDLFLSGRISEKEFIGELKMSWVDYSGKEVARYFRHGGSSEVPPVFWTGR